MRRRKLPAEYVMWIVIGMALLRDRSIRAVVRHLDLVLPTRGRRERVSGSAIVQARERLGPEPLAALFALTAAAWGPAAAEANRWRGLAVYGVDGSTVRIPDARRTKPPSAVCRRAGRAQAVIRSCASVRGGQASGMHHLHPSSSI